MIRQKLLKPLALAIVGGTLIGAWPLITNAQAGGYCSWVQGPGSYANSKICASFQMQAAQNNGQCDPAQKPVISEISSNKAVCCCGATTPPAPTAQEKPKFIMPDLQISIPGLTLTPSSSIDSTCDNNGNCQVVIPWLAEYLSALYKYGLSIAGILAAIVLMGGGLLWLVSGGDASRVTQAKEMIGSSVIGLVILFSSYIILYQINPQLINLPGITLNTIQPEEIPSPADTAQFSAHCVAQQTGECATSKMAVFGDRANQASAICNAESGGNPKIFNAQTACTNGGYAVWGLFQFNLSANKFTDQNGTVLDCPSAFGNRVWTNTHHTCTITDQTLYDKCVAAATTPALSISNAYQLTKNSKTTWGPWESNSKWCHFAN